MKTKDAIINYEVEGNGEPLVLVHGVGANLGSWDSVVEELKPDYQILRLDLRGHGKSAMIDGEMSIEDFAVDVIRMMDDAGIQKAHLVGFSLGGLIAQKMATQFADRLHKIVILSAVAGRTSEERSKVVARLDMIRSGGMRAITGAAKDRWFTEDFARKNPDLIERRIEELEAVHLPSYLEAYRVFGTTELIDTLPAIRHRVLVMTGEFDQGSNVRMAHDMRRLLSNSELIILPGLKHSVLVEAPLLVAGHIRDFLQDLN